MVQKLQELLIYSKFDGILFQICYICNMYYF